MEGNNTIPRCKHPRVTKPSRENPLDSKIEGMQRLQKMITQDKAFSKDITRNRDKTDDLFTALKASLSSNSLYSIMFNQVPNQVDKSQGSAAANNDKVVDTILHANQVVFELLPEITTHDEYEKQIAFMIPYFIENLGSPKAIVRKSTHKCIGTYVKLTKKLEYVLMHIIQTGLENSNSRTRQHSMLVLPALLSLKPSAVERENPEMKELIQAVVKRIQTDSSEIVSKTGKKLLLELQKCYGASFKANQVDTLTNFEARQICYAVLASDDEKLKELLTNPIKVNHEDILIGPAALAMKDKSAAQVGPAKSVTNNTNHYLNLSYSGAGAAGGPSGNSQLLHKAGREIMNTAGRDIIAGGSVKKQDQPDVQEKPTLKFQQTPKGTLTIEGGQQPQITSSQNQQHPVGENGLLYGFLNEEVVQNLDENKPWKERTAAIEYIEDQLNVMMGSLDKKQAFLPYLSSFLAIILVFIKDINFKICLTAINISRKLLSLDVNCFSKHKTQLTTSLIEKLSDSKVVIRQAVLKCCGFLIQNSHKGLLAIAYHSIGYLQHTNWHVREGILHLLADCIISQGNLDELSSPVNQRQETLDPNHLAFNSHFISELCTLAKIEAKSKIQQMVIDCLALILDISPNRQKTEQLMMRELGITEKSSQKRNDNDFLVKLQKEVINIMNPKSTQIDYLLINHIKQRQNKDYLPTMQLDGTIEFKPPGVISDMLPMTPNKVAADVKAQADNGNHYLQMRHQQQRIQQNSLQKGSEQVAGNMLPAIQKKEINNNLSPGPARQNDTSPYAQMLEKNRQYSVTVNKDQSHKQSRISDDQPQPFQTPSMQMSKQDGLTQFARGPAPQSLMKQKTNENFEKGSRNNDEKIGIRLPQNKDGSQSQLNQKQYQNTAPNEQRSHYAIQKSINQQKQQQSERINATAPSAVTFIDDGSSIQTTGTHLSSQATAIQNKGHMIVNNQVNKAPQRHKLGANQSGLGDSQFQIQSTQDASTKLGYTPESHLNQARDIYSNEMKQRTLDGELISQNSQIQQIGNQTKNDFISIQQSPRNINDQKQMTSQIGRATQGIINNNDFQAQQRNMSQSSGAPGGFNIDKTQINKRLQLLKSTFKYKNTSEIDQNEEIKTFDNSERIKYEVSNHKAESEHNNKLRNQRKITKNSNNFMTPSNFENDINQPGNPQVTHNSFGMSNISSKLNTQSAAKDQGNVSAINFKRSVLNANHGPIKATSAVRQKDGLSTINFDDQQQISNSHKNSQLIIKHQISAPPLPRKPSTLVKKQNDNLLEGSPSDIKRVSSVTNNNSNFSGYKKEEIGETPNTSYIAADEPFVNPEQELKICMGHLKGDNWEKIFNGLNILKRMVLFHKDVIQLNNCGKDIIKIVVKHTDSMRSQISKNSCMTLQVIYSELNQKDLDGVVDIVLTTVLKKAIDTNHFVSEQADKALATVCHACNENKVFQCLQMMPNKGPIHRLKICICYGNVIQKLGSKIATFKECMSLVKTVVNLLTDGAQEVRNEAKLAILTIRNNLNSRKEFDQLMIRCGLTDKQLDQCKKVVELGDAELLSNNLNTKYGQSMRGSSLDSKGAIKTKNIDGYTQSSFNMGNSVVSPNSSAANGFGSTSNSHAFKKRQASVSKPIDPQIYEQFRAIIDQCMLPDWQQRLNALDNLNGWIESHSSLIKNSQHAKFIQLVDIYCKLIQDNNAKVQNKSLTKFTDFLSNEDLRVLIDTNITLIIQALTHNLLSTSNHVKQHSEQLFSLLEQKSQNINQIVQPIVAQINLPNQRLKAYLIQRLIILLPKLDSQIIDRHIKALTQRTNKIQQEATTNPKLREQLQMLDTTLRSY